MNEKRSFRLTLAVVIVAIAALAFACVFFTACGDDTPKFAITWSVSEHAEVTVTGYETLPGDVAENTELSLTAKGKSGYNIASIKINGKAIAADADGVYKFTVGADTEVTVEVSKVISSVSVKTKPAKLTYYAGETLDKKDMVVEVSYATGDKENVDDYAVVYSHGDAFAIGDTSFAVSYKKTTSAAVDLKTAVECRIVLDPAGGTIGDDYYAELAANAALHNLAKAEDGAVSFTFAALESDIALPVAEQMSKGDDGDFTFRGWKSDNEGFDKIKTDLAVSKNLTAAFDANLLSLDSIAYENRTKTEGGVEVSVPYLVIKGTFRASTEAYLYLYEGNDKVELVGDSLGGEGTNKGDSFDFTFDMRNLVAKEYKGKWMDIKFKAQVAGRDEQMEINLGDYGEDFVDLDQKLVNGDYVYSFKTYENTLKAVYADYFYADFVMAAGTNDDGNPTLTFNGKTSAKYAGKTVRVDFWIDSTVEEYAVIGADGSWTMTFVLDDRFPLNKDGYAHFSVVESKDDPTLIYKDGNDGNMLNDNCINTDLKNVSVGLIENAGAIRCATADSTRAYYVGKGKWGGIVVRGVNEAIVQTGVTVELKDEKPYLVISGTYNTDWTADSAVSKIKTEICGFVELQNCGDVTKDENWTSYPLSLGAPADGDTPAVPATILAEAADGNWKVYLDLSVGKAGEVLFVHYGASDTAKSDLESDNIAKTTITANGLTYRSDVFTGWGRNVAVVYIETSAAEA